MRLSTGAGRTVRRTGVLLGWAFSLTLTGVIAASVLVPRAVGATPYVVLTGSMRPELPPGTLVVARPVPPSDIGVGDVITYQLESGQQTVVTHRVVAQGVDRQGHRVFQTRGDANPTADPAWVRPVQVRGERWYAVPYVGLVGNLLSRHQHEILTYGLGWLLLGYAARMFLGSWRHRARVIAARPSVAPVEGPACG